MAHISYEGEMKHMEEHDDDRWSVDHVFYSEDIDKLRQAWRVLKLMLCNEAEMRLMAQWQEEGGVFWLHVRILAPFEKRFQVMREIAAARKVIAGE